MNNYKIELGLYQDCLYEIKRRIDVIADHINKVTTEKYLIIEIETICLQFRKILANYTAQFVFYTRQAPSRQPVAQVLLRVCRTPRHSTYSGCKKTRLYQKIRLNIRARMTSKARNNIEAKA